MLRCLAVGLVLLGAASVFAAETHVYATTSAQGFREVLNADWSSLRGPGSQIVDVDAAKRMQAYRGIGGSFAEASCFTLMRLPEAKRAAAFEMLFGKTGLGLSIGRVHCGSSDYSLHFYSYDDVAGDTALEHFSIDDDRKWVIPAIREAKKVNPDLFLFSSPWSAPGWMTENGMFSGARLRPDLFGVYAEYVVRFLKAYAAEGLPLGAHTVQNEGVLLQMDENSPTMVVPAADEARLALELRKRFDRDGLKTKIWLFDHNYSDARRLDEILAVKGVPEAVDGIAWHSYSGEPETVRRYVERYPKFEQIHTEMGPHIDRSKRNFLWWGDLILRGFNAGQSGFTNWCLALDENGHPNTSCGHPCVGLIAVHSQTGEIEPSDQFAAFRHISPFVKRGAKVLDAPIRNDIPGGGAAKRLEKTVVSSFENPDGTFVVVINHPGETGAQVMIRHAGRYLPVVVLAKSLTTVTF